MPDTFRYKPAPLGAHAEVTVDSGGVALKRGRHERSARFAEVTGARLVEVNMRTSSTTLVLLFPGGKFLLQAGMRPSAAASDRHTAGFVAACVATLEALGRARPDVEVAFGGGQALRATIAGLGVALAMMALLLGFIAFDEGSGGMMDRIYLGAAALGLIAGGIGMAAKFNPFARLPTASAADAARALRAFLPEQAEDAGDGNPGAQGVD